MVKTCKIIIPLILLFVFCPAVFAYSTTQITYNLSNSGNFQTLTFYTNSFQQIGTSDFYDTGNGELVSSDISIPLTIYVAGQNPYTGFLNGAYKFSYKLTLTGSSAVDFRNLNVDFQVANNPGVYLATYENQRTTATNSISLNFNLYFVFRNFYWNSNSGQNIITANVHYSALTSDGSGFQCTIVPDLSAGSGNLNHTAEALSESEIAVSVASAIDNSADVQTIISWLSSIRSDTTLLSQVLSKISDLDTKLALVISHISTMEQQDLVSQGLLRGIWFALSGMSNVGNLDTETSNTIKNYWIGIISEALENVYPDVAYESQKASDANEQISQNEAIEETVYNNYSQQVAEVDFEPVAPANIAMSISHTVGWLEQIYAKLGIFQWVIILTCTVGIVLIVLGRFRLK